MKRCASHVNTVQKTSIPEGVLINQVDRMTRLADTNQVLSLPTLELAKVKWPMNRVGLVEGMEAIHEPNQMNSFPLSKADLVAECKTCPDAILFFKETNQ